MTEYKDKRGKALIAAGVATFTNRIESILAPLTIQYPQLTAPLWAVVSGTGLLLAYKQERLNQFVEYLMKNQRVFSDELFNDPDFTDGMTVFISSYWRLRSDKKLTHAQNIFYNFSMSNEKQIYPLERYDDTLEKISDKALEYLGFIDENFPDIKESFFTSRLLWDDGNHEAFPGRSAYQNLPMGQYLEDYVERMAKSEAPGAPGDKNISDIEKIKQRLWSRFESSQDELEQLGLGRYIPKTLLGGKVSGSYFELNNYGWEFISVIKPDESLAAAQRTADALDENNATDNVQS